MADREKVIRGLEACVYNQRLMQCESCPYHTDKARCLTTLMRDALALLKEQEARILTLEEALSGKNGIETDPYVWVEVINREDIFLGSVTDISHFKPEPSFEITRSFGACRSYQMMEYMKTVRCWTHKPTDEQRNNTPWEGECEDA